MWGNCGTGWYFSWVVYKIGPKQNEKSFQQILTLKMVYQAHKVKLNWIWADKIQDLCDWLFKKKKMFNAISGNKHVGKLKLKIKDVRKCNSIAY